MKKKRIQNRQTPPLHTHSGNPETVWDIINQYGTYNIQPTADTDNPYPAIAQGNPYRPDEEIPSARSQLFIKAEDE